MICKDWPESGKSKCAKHFETIPVIIINTSSIQTKKDHGPNNLCLSCYINWHVERQICSHFYTATSEQ
jgi:hypothetical protein